jgi:hypothetical protein
VNASGSLWGAVIASEAKQSTYFERVFLYKKRGKISKWIVSEIALFAIGLRTLGQASIKRRSD